MERERGRDSKGEIFSALSRVARRDIADFKRIDDAGDAQNVRLTHRSHCYLDMLVITLRIGFLQPLNEWNFLIFVGKHNCARERESEPQVR